MEERKGKKKPSQFACVIEKKLDNSEVDANLLFVSLGSDVLSES